jgi:hypothetical protein
MVSTFQLKRSVRLSLTHTRIAAPALPAAVKPKETHRNAVKPYPRRQPEGIREPARGNFKSTSSHFDLADCIGSTGFVIPAAYSVLLSTAAALRKSDRSAVVRGPLSFAVPTSHSPVHGLSTYSP